MPLSFANRAVNLPTNSFSPISHKVRHLPVVKLIELAIFKFRGKLYDKYILKLLIATCKTGIIV